MKPPRATKADLLAENAALQKSIAQEKARRQRVESAITELESRLGSHTRELAEALEQQTASAEILQVISSSRTDAQPVFDAIASRAVRLCDALFSTVYRYDGQLIHHTADNYPTSEMRAILTTGYPSSADRNSATAQAIRDKRIIHIEDALDDATPAASREVAIALGYRTLLCVPMLCDGLAIGSIAVARREQRRFADRQIHLIKTFAEQAVIAIENVRLFTELQARNKELTEALERQTATSEILRVISSSPTDVQPVFDAIARNAVALCGGIGAVVLRFDGEMLHLAGHHNASPEALARVERAYPRQPARDYPPGRAFLDRTVVQVSDLQAATEFAASTARQRGAGSQLAVPLLRDDKAIGVFSLARDHVGPFSSQQIGVLQTFAEQAVIAIENVRLFTELQEKNKALTTANAQVTESLEQQTATADILRVISSSPTDVQPVFDTIVRSAVRLCDGLYGAVARFDGERMHLAANYNYTADALLAVQQMYPMRPDRQQMLGRAILTRAIVHVEDALADPELAQHVARAGGFRGMLAVPMLREGSPIGAIFVTREQPGPFSQTQIALLQTFADQAVIAIENVRLFTELQQKNTALTQAHAQVSQALEQQTATSEVLRVISSSPTDVQPVFTAMAASAARLCEARDATIFRVDGDVLRLVAHEGPIAPDVVLPLTDGTIGGRVIRQRRAFHVADMQAAETHDYPISSEFARNRGFRTILSVPLLHGGQAIGLIAIRRTEVRPFTDRQVELVKTFAAQAVIAIERSSRDSHRKCTVV